MPVTEGNVGLAFGISFAAGAATMVGASAVFFPRLVKLASKRVLAGSLGFAAGVMLYISFVDLFFVSFESFQDSGMEDSHAYSFATLCVFMGIVLMKIIDVIVHRLGDNPYPYEREMAKQGTLAQTPCGKQVDEDLEEEVDINVPTGFGCSADPVGDQQKWQAHADAEINAITREDSTVLSTVTGGLDVVPTCDEYPDKNQENQSDEPATFDDDDIISLAPVQPCSGEELFQLPAELTSEVEKNKLLKMGFATAVAIAMHNFPEGVATFVASLNDPSTGAVLGIAIGAHNIPEGLCVALPIFYATGSRWKGFWWAFISGMAEPLAAIVAWLVLANVMSDEVYGVMFGLVSGMMVMLSLSELLPTAHKYDPEDSVVTACTIVGMSVMALSLILFEFSG
ncbi:hypothetical protein HJC23_001191 [Cyclotella cryptica]|uniref:Zinc transporter n=1 Tax=Cyclotella cryptica TaxID=29204 RepID=A0ABD3QUV1_9STRA|eukprot:CCRYP_003837-RA/>CCRYP_003837-RA protein AED:0.02 eAED:0.02 QI:241/1/1/1/1/1/3/261/396